ncbi:MAG: bifunctional 2-C-methyl-D-erythritol 4-phosphate cytidylyltransferase/2-C-methyl-D-erythritol 2,4-cyclodiphosphate synthase [Sphingomicrobium sp.]|nr:bifunctional 2-C-methyl-D-erythritol 4-phosphate cytidylyltransferase/2-C-methyl-D-erythritol 2,4-cyclodiphosphate synthase [Sphingomonadales bacterium]
MADKPHVTALIVAAGSGSRMGAEIPKQFRLLAGKPMLRHAVEALIGHPRIGAVRVVIGSGQEQAAAAALAGLDVGTMIEGGPQRSDSVAHGLAVIDDGGIVLIHDAARPFCPAAVIDRLLDALGTHHGAVPVLPVADTLARSVGTIDQIVDRKNVLRVQTPQAFYREDLLYALEQSGRKSATDESSVMIAAGLKVAAVPGDMMLDKLTTHADWARAEERFAAHLISRSGIGFDVHAFAGEGPLMLGGVSIAHDRGLAGHSDADVVLHAITDALLGAAGLGDIGEHFPPSNAQWKGASSDRFLLHAARLVRQAGGIVDHVDCTIICEAPKIGPYRDAIRARVAEILGLDPQTVSIKATTTERLGFTGRKEGIAAQAIATVRLPSPHANGAS